MAGSNDRPCTFCRSHHLKDWSCFWWSSTVSHTVEDGSRKFPSPIRLSTWFLARVDDSSLIRFWRMSRDTAGIDEGCLENHPGDSHHPMTKVYSWLWCLAPFVRRSKMLEKFVDSVLVKSKPPVSHRIPRIDPDWSKAFWKISKHPNDSALATLGEPSRRFSSYIDHGLILPLKVLCRWQSVRSSVKDLVTRIDDRLWRIPLMLMATNDWPDRKCLGNFPSCPWSGWWFVTAPALKISYYPSRSDWLCMQRSDTISHPGLFWKFPD